MIQAAAMSGLTCQDHLKPRKLDHVDADVVAALGVIQLPLELPASSVTHTDEWLSSVATRKQHVFLLSASLIIGCVKLHAAPVPLHASAYSGKSVEALASWWQINVLV